MIKKNQKKEIIIWSLFLVMFPLPLLSSLFIDNRPLLLGNERFPIIVGLVAYSWFLLEIFISSRPRWLEQKIGLPNLYMVHGCIGILAIILAFLHKMNLHAEGLPKLYGDIAINLFIGVSIISLLFLSSIISNTFKVVASFKKHISKFTPKREIILWVHRLTVVATILVFLHVVTMPVLRGSTFFLLIFSIESLLILCYYAYCKLIVPGLQPAYQIASLNKFNQDTLKIELQTDGKRIKPHKPGDYLFLSFKDRKISKEYHPFSIINSTREDGRLFIAVKQIGDFTKNIENSTLGSLVRVAGPYGLLHQHLDLSKPLLLIAGGIGITPIMSIIEASSEEQKIYLFWNVKKTEDLIFNDELKERQKNSLLHYIPLLSEEKSTDYYYGRVNSRLVKQLLTEEEIKSLNVVMCGPEKMMTSMDEQLQELGVSVEKIHYEKFSY
ncbi:FAD-binding oxidoreductase [Carnobacterium maltaromaticum]|uniref:FAD-binding oxidoreductase n=1 Tax=Carnobacterium maltaromaticum TaxID=2751 RepID=UPI00295F2D3E|nr:FAD-binding oxidoreductase [Carnobacterium maltaromaticum]